MAAIKSKSPDGDYIVNREVLDECHAALAVAVHVLEDLAILVGADAAASRHIANLSHAKDLLRQALHGSGVYYNGR